MLLMFKRIVYALISLTLIYVLTSYKMEHSSILGFSTTGLSTIGLSTGWLSSIQLSTTPAVYISGISIFLFGFINYIFLAHAFVGVFRPTINNFLFLISFIFCSIGLTFLTGVLKYNTQQYVGIIGYFLYQARQLIPITVTIYEAIIFILIGLTLLLFSWDIDLKKLMPSQKLKNIIKEKTKKSSVKIQSNEKLPKKTLITTEKLPTLSLLNTYAKQKQSANTWNPQHRLNRLVQVLQEFGVKGKIIKSSIGPVVTLYELQPEPGVKAIRIIGLASDIARSMSALSARIATIPGKDVIGIELSNPVRETVYLADVFNTPEYQESEGLALAMGCDIGGSPVISNLATMPHMLVAGTTGSGKSVAIHTILLSLLFKHTPETCRLILIDPKMLELSMYNDLPHLLTPVVTEPKMAVVALKWAIQEMEKRYRLLSAAGVRNLADYNAKHLEKLPYIVIVVDELADLMLVAGKEIDSSIQRLAQMARAAGIHVILATQRPSVDVITGTIKANFPTRVTFQLASKIDSRTILGDYAGAELLLGKGDMLYLNSSKLQRVHGPFVSTAEVEMVVNHWKSQEPVEYEDISIADQENDLQQKGYSDVQDDPLFEAVLEYVRNTKRASASSIQREFSIGFNKAARYLDIMEKLGKVSAQDSMGRRKVIG